MLILKLIQLMPVNDTTATHTWLDSYPYAAISAFALHPLYLNLNRLATAANRRWLKTLEPVANDKGQMTNDNYLCPSCAMATPAPSCASIL